MFQISSVDLEKSFRHKFTMLAIMSLKKDLFPYQ